MIHRSTGGCPGPDFLRCLLPLRRRLPCEGLVEVRVGSVKLGWYGSIVVNCLDTVTSSLTILCVCSKENKNFAYFFAENSFREKIQIFRTRYNCPNVPCIKQRDRHRLGQLAHQTYRKLRLCLHPSKPLGRSRRMFHMQVCIPSRRPSVCVSVLPCVPPRLHSGVDGRKSNVPHVQKRLFERHCLSWVENSFRYSQT